MVYFWDVYSILYCMYSSLMCCQVLYCTVVGSYLCCKYQVCYITTVYWCCKYHVCYITYCILFRHLHNFTPLCSSDCTPAGRPLGCPSTPDWSHCWYPCLAALPIHGRHPALGTVQATRDRGRGDGKQRPDGAWWWCCRGVQWHHLHHNHLGHGSSILVRPACLRLSLHTRGTLQVLFRYRKFNVITNGTSFHIRRLLIGFTLTQDTPLPVH